MICEVDNREVFKSPELLYFGGILCGNSIPGELGAPILLPRWMKATRNAPSSWPTAL